ncbi:hypothetical protein ACJX0J_023006, partial [Zea mays]
NESSTAHALEVWIFLSLLSADTEHPCKQHEISSVGTIYIICPKREHTTCRHYMYTIYMHNPCVSQFFQAEFWGFIDWVDLSLNEVPLFGRKYTPVLWEDNFPNTFLRFGILWQLWILWLAFIKGRFIQDNFMLVDITKAFDSVSWPFLIELWMFLSNVYPIQIFSLVASRPFRAVKMLIYLVMATPTTGRWIADITGSLSSESLDHILVSCVFAREFWICLLLFLFFSLLFSLKEIKIELSHLASSFGDLHMQMNHVVYGFYLFT